MKKLILIAAVLSLTVIAPPSFSDEDPAMNAKIARLKAKQRALVKAAGEEGNNAGEKPACADVSIGNIENDSSVRGNTENVVVVTGDVIAISGRNCKAE
jgi:hypothetical protein